MRRPAILRQRPGLAWLPLALLATGLLWFLYGKTQASSPAARAAIEEQLRSIHQFDSDWNVDVMSSKVGLNASYDPIVAPFPKILEQLGRVEAGEGASDSDVKARLLVMRGVFLRKADLVDEFKSRNSVLRNSLRFLPTAARDAEAALAAEPAARGARPADLLPEVGGTLAEALKYAVVIDEAQRDQLEAAVLHLQAGLDALPGASGAREPLAVFLTHARTVHAKIGNEASLLSGIVQVPTVAAIDSSAAAFDGYFAVAQRQSEFWRKALFAYSALLLSVAAFTAWRLRQSYREIERRVAHRTRELADALASLRESEAQLIQSEKMSSLGQMVAGVVHEINTPLAYVRSSLETIGDQLEEVNDLVRHGSAMLVSMSEPEPDADRLAQSFASFSALTSNFADLGVADEMRRLAADSLHGVDQISEIVVNLRNFCRLDRSKTTLFDLREGLDSTLVIARGAIGPHRVVKRYADIPEVVCAPSQINQVFLNLITNAAQALPAEGGGTITLSTGLEDDMVRVEVADSGSGIQEQHLARIFDPFFTTKEIGKGTGLGLSIAYKIVQEHAGRIGVRSTLGGGTTFTIHLPRQPAPALAENGIPT
jgi:two-component system, NtrC family, sensor kinase